MTPVWRRAYYALWATATNFSKLQLSMIAAGIAFYGILALFPALTALIAAWSFIADPAVVQSQLELAEAFIPPEAYSLINQQVSKLVSTGGTTLGWASALSIGGAIWSARLGVTGLMQGLNVAYRRQGRGTIHQTATSLSITLMLIGVAMTALAAVVVTPVLLTFLPLGPSETSVLSAIRWVIAGALVVTALNVLYRFGPNRARDGAAWLTPGAVLAVLIWVTVSWLLSFYLSNFADYNEVYGTLGAVIALLMWLWLSAIAVLVGALLNAEWESRRPPEDLQKVDEGSRIEA